MNVPVCSCISVVSACVSVVDMQSFDNENGLRTDIGLGELKVAAAVVAATSLVASLNSSS